MTPPPDPLAPAGGPPACVLIAEDDAEINALLAEAFREVGCEVLQAFDGLQAVDLARARRPAVILLDLDLPRLYGHLILRSLRRDPFTAHIGVVVLTGRPELLSAEDRAAADAVLHKPVGLDAILDAVRTALHRP